MIRVSQWAEIRHMHLVAGVPKKEVARRLGLDVKTVRRALSRSEAAFERRSPARGRRLDPWREKMVAWLRGGAWPKRGSGSDSGCRRKPGGAEAEGRGGVGAQFDSDARVARPLRAFGHKRGSGHTEPRQGARPRPRAHAAVAAAAWRSDSRKAPRSSAAATSATIHSQGIAGAAATIWPRISPAM